MIEISIAGQVAFVTGGASGIGRAAAKALARADATVALVDRDGAGAEAAAADIREAGGTCEVFTLDLTDHASIPGVVAAVLERFGRIDILVNAAGIADNTTSINDLGGEMWDKVFATNLKAPFLLIKEVTRHMVARGGGGKIVNVSSSSSFRGKRSGAAYSSSKSGINQLTRIVAGEFGAHDINVNCVVPGMTNTAMIGAANHDLVKEGPLANFMGRISEAEDVGNVILFLCTPMSRQITGQMIHTSAGAIV